MEHNLWLKWLKLFGFFNGAHLLAEMIGFGIFMEHNFWLRSETIVGGRQQSPSLQTNKVILTKVWDWKREKCQYFKICWYLYSLWHLRFHWPSKTQNIFLPSPRNFMFTRGGHFTLAKRKRSKKWKGEGSLDFLRFPQWKVGPWVWHIGSDVLATPLT